MAKDMSRRDFVTLVGGSIGAVLLAGCGTSKQDEAEPVEAGTDAIEPIVTDVVVDYGQSELYSTEDMDAAIDAILLEFGTWNGCTLQRIAFTDDETCAKDLEYVNQLRDADAPEFDQAIVLTTDFHSPNAELAEGTAWDPDKDYEGWSWHLGRTGSDGKWELMSWGYA